MKFFWKLYFSIMTITIICFSASGYMLIQTSFTNAFEREVETIYQENDILINTLTLELLPYVEKISVNDANYHQQIDMFKHDVSNLMIDGSIMFCVRLENGEVLYQNTTINDDSLFKKILPNERGYVVKREKNEYKLLAMRAFSTSGTKLYFENTRDISELFLNRESQFKTLLYYTIILSLVSGLVIFLVTRWLVSPISKLSKATKRMAEGATVKPLPVTSEDEIGQLTTDFNTMWQRLSATMAELKAAVERQEIFIGNFAHELKTPLTSIIGYGDMLRLKRLGEADIISYSSLIVEEGKRLEAMSMKLLDLIVLKKQDFKMERIDAQIFLQGIADTISLLMNEKEIDFVVEAEPGYLNIEADLMKTVCLNLLDNAKKAVQPGGKISLRGKSLLNGYQIIVVDNGCGIEASEIDKIKAAFYMVDKSRSRSNGGAGLGLAICEEIIKLHHASITFESVVNQGTTVIVTLMEDN